MVHAHSDNSRLLWPALWRAACLEAAALVKEGLEERLGAVALGNGQLRVRQVECAPPRQQKGCLLVAKHQVADEDELLESLQASS